MHHYLLAGKHSYAHSSKYDTICVPCSRQSFGNLSANIAESSPEHCHKCAKTSPQVNINNLKYETICVSCSSQSFGNLPANIAESSPKHRRKFAKTSLQVRRNIAASSPKHRRKPNKAIKKFAASLRQTSFAW